MAKKRLRMNNYYNATIEDGALTLHHTPMALFYYADGKKFFQKRIEAYHILADKGLTDVTKVVGRSYVIDYSRDGFEIHYEKPEFMDDTVGLFILWVYNVRNWFNPLRWFKVFKHLKKGQVCVGEMDWQTFKAVFGTEVHRSQCPRSISLISSTLKWLMDDPSR